MNTWNNYSNPVSICQSCINGIIITILQWVSLITMAIINIYRCCCLINP